MKKILSILLTFVMVVSFTSVVAFAEDDQLPKEGKITISKPAEDTIYNIYRILSFGSASDNYSLVTYRVADGWQDFFTEEEVLQYVSIDANGAVTAKSTFTQSSAPAFAKLAIDYVKKVNSDGYSENDIDAVETKTAIGNEDLVFENLPLGYYLVDTSVGSLCGLTTTQPTASIAIKNVAPTMSKSVEEDSNAGTGTNAFGATNTADIGQIVNFDVTINAQNGAENYVYHDKIADSFTILNTVQNPIVVKYHQSNGSTDNLTNNEDFILTVIEDSECTFKIEFKEDFLKNVGTGDKIYILYSAILNEEAETENTNTGWLTYGDSHSTTKVSTVTYTYGFDIVKTDASTPSKMLDGAVFQLYEEQDSSEPIKMVKVNENEYRRATNKDIEDNNTAITTNINVTLADGKAVAGVFGLDNDDYYLKETKSPAGYNAMAGFKEIIIFNKSIKAEFDNGTYKTNTGVQVVNQVGTVLPTTGGTGTTLFITIGAIFVIVAGVLLVTKKRMTMIED